MKIRITAIVDVPADYAGDLVGYSAEGLSFEEALKWVIYDAALEGVCDLDITTAEEIDDD
jgi:hypothetical protein